MERPQRLVHCVFDRHLIVFGDRRHDHMQQRIEIIVVGADPAVHDLIARQHDSVLEPALFTGQQRRHFGDADRDAHRPQGPQMLHDAPDAVQIDHFVVIGVVEQRGQRIVRTDIGER